MLEVHGTEYLGNGHFGEQKTKEVLAFVSFCLRYASSISANNILEPGRWGFHSCHDCPRNVGVKPSHDLVAEFVEETIFADSFMAVGESHVEFKKEPT